MTFLDYSHTVNAQSIILEHMINYFLRIYKIQQLASNLVSNKQM